MMESDTLYVILLSGTGLFFLLQMLYFRCYLWKPVSYYRHVGRKKTAESAATPAVSVIVCAHNQSELLARHLPYLLEQEYPDYEVVVVDEGSFDETHETLSALAKKYNRLYHTYIPHGAKLNRKKLALSIGIKAARNEVLLFTEADCCPLSRNWIRAMVANFDERTDIVTGYGALPSDDGLMGQLFVYDNLIDNLRAFAMTLRKKPYTAKGTNLAYRKRLFLNGKGFQPYLHLKSGADDLFVNTEATPTNTRIEMSPESVTIRIRCDFKIWKGIKIAQLTTRRYYKPGPRMLWALEGFSRFGFWASAVAVCFLAPLWTLPAVAALFVLLRWAALGFVLNRAARILQRNVQFCWSIPLLEILQPVFNGYFLVVHLFKRKSDYTWKMKSGRG
jgi:glycosyltransferase involved in cell wall biosynthesis